MCIRVGWLRPLLAAALALSLATPALGESFRHENGVLHLSEPPQRIVTLNWAATEAALLLGVEPVGVADLGGYRHWVEEPALPEEGIHNVGTRVAPSLQAIAELEPDLIITSSEMAPAAGLLERIAPTYVMSVYRKGVDPYVQARELLLNLGRMLGRSAQAEAVLSEVNASLAHSRDKLAEAGFKDSALALVSFLDHRHVRVYTENGLFDATLDALGLENAWPHDGNFWGFSVVGLESIAPLAGSRLMVLSPTPPGLKDTLAASPFWTHLPQVRQKQVYRIGTVWPFGGIYQVKRLGQYITESLMAGGSDHVL